MGRMTNGKMRIIAFKIKAADEVVSKGRDAYSNRPTSVSPGHA